MVKLSYRINQNIKAKKVRLIDQKGKQLEVMEISRALAIAKDRKLDLVEVAPAAKPPVCKLWDFQRFLREQKKRRKAARRSSTRVELKEIRIRPNIGKADLNVRVKLAKKFLRKRNRVKLTVIYRGREISHPEVGLEKINALTESLKEIAKMEESPKRKGRSIEVTLVPRDPAIKTAFDGHQRGDVPR